MNEERIEAMERVITKLEEEKIDVEERLKSRIEQFDQLEKSHHRLKEEFHKLFEEKKRLLFEEVNKLSPLILYIIKKFTKFK